MSNNIIKKISVKTVVGDVKKMVASGEFTGGPIMRVLGHVEELKHGETDNGPWIALLGTFEATNLLTGETFNASKCFLPDVLGDMVVAQLQRAKAEDANAAIQFGADVGIKLEPSSAVGYTYMATPLTQKSADPLEALRLEVSQKAPLQLAAPVEAGDAPAPKAKAAKK